MIPPAELQGQVIALHHVAIAVRKIESVAPFYAKSLGLETIGEPEFVADQKVNILILTAGGQRIELIEPASDDSPITRFVEKREGLHHLAWEVNDLEKVLARLKQQGMRLIDEAPRNGAHNTRIAFLHPASCGGVLTELVEVAASSSH
jgi:methylmalonyl-CoA/ethylmalonyl-CoA epimerase